VENQLSQWLTKSLGQECPFGIHYVLATAPKPARYRLRQDQGLSLYFDNLDPIRALTHLIAHWVAELSARLVDSVNRKSIRFLSGGNKILFARIDIDVVCWQN
jgi:hypothetical protein